MAARLLHISGICGHSGPKSACKTRQAPVRLSLGYGCYSNDGGRWVLQSSMVILSVFFWSRIFHFVISAECDAGSSFAVALRFISTTSYGSALSLISVPVARIFNSKISDFLKK